MDLDPAGGLLDALAGVVRSPALDKTHPEDAQPPQVIYADACRCRQTWVDGERGVGFGGGRYGNKRSAFNRQRKGISKSVCTKQDSKQDLILFSLSVCILLIAGAMPPTDPGPGMFPATAAAWAAAAAWAVAACCCICLWHWRRSNTWRDRTNIKRCTFRWSPPASTVQNAEGWSFDPPKRQKKCHLCVVACVATLM